MAETSANKLRRRVLTHVATTSKDPMEVTTAVDNLFRMRALSLSLTTSVGLHPQWVMGHTTGPADEVEFCVRNCHDTDTLTEIALHNRRVGVAKELVDNEHLSHEACQAVLARFGQVYCRFNHDQDNAPEVPTPVEIPEHLRVPEKFSRDKFREFSLEDPLSRLDQSISVDGVTSDDVDELVAKALEINEVATVAHIIHALYWRGYNSEKKAEFWGLMSAEPLDLLEALDQEGRREVLTGALKLKQWVRNWHGLTPIRLWGKRFVKLLMEADIDQEAREALPGSDPSCRLLTSRALQLILSDPTWARVAMLHQPNSRELKLILKTLGEDYAPRLNGISGATSSVVATTLAYKGPGAVEKPFARVPFGDMSYLFSGPDDPLFQRVLEGTSNKDLVNYILRGTRFRTSNYTKPTVDQVVQLAERINADGDAVATVRALDTCPAGDSIEYANAVRDNIACAWEAYIERDPSGSLFADLAENGVEPAALIEVLLQGDTLAALTWPQVKETLGCSH
jgi:hypothetical protein